MRISDWSSDVCSSDLYCLSGIEESFVQVNHSVSKQGTIRGMHFQRSPGQAKLVSVIAGKIFDVVVDIRPDSPTFGKWEGVYLDDQIGRAPCRERVCKDV